MSEEFEEQNSLLRDWYLAHLRKGALAEREKLQMTPAALIAADHDIVMKLAANKAVPAKTTPSVERDTSTRTLAVKFLAAWVILCSCFWIWLLIDSGGNPGQASRYYAMLTVDVWMENPANSARLPISPLFLLLPALFYGLPLMGVVVLLIKGQRLWLFKGS